MKVECLKFLENLVFFILKTEKKLEKLILTILPHCPPRAENAPQTQNAQLERSIEFEEIRRKIFTDIKDVSYYIDSELTNRNLAKHVAQIKPNFKHRIK